MFDTTTLPLLPLADVAEPAAIERQSTVIGLVIGALAVVAALLIARMVLKRKG